MTLALTRRHFAAGAFAGAVLPNLEDAEFSHSSPAGPEGFKLGVASYSLREFQRGLVIRFLKELNVSYVSLKEFHLPYRSSPEELHRAAKEFANAGITIAGGGTIYIMRDEESDIRRYFEYAWNARMPLMTIGPTLKTLPTIEKFVKEYDIKVAIHNHGPEDKHFPTPEVALKAIQGMDPRVGVCVDLANTARTGANTVESIRSAGKRLLDVHIRDMRDLRDGETEVPVGEGAMPVPEIFRQLKAMDYRGCVNLEYEIDADNPLTGMAKSLSYMRGVLAALRG